MPKEKRIVTQRGLQVGDTITKVFGPTDPSVDYEVEREIPWVLPGGDGTVIRLKPAKAVGFRLAANTFVYDWPTRQWWQTGSTSTYNNDAMLRLVDAAGGFDTLYVSPM